MPTMSKRKIVQITAAVRSDDYAGSGMTFLYALCDDSSVWCITNLVNWHRLPEILQGELGPSQAQESV
jgi:hypothetical protein